MCDNDGSPLEGGINVYNFYGTIFGEIRNILKLFNILKIWMVSDKTIHMHGM